MNTVALKYRNDGSIASYYSFPKALQDVWGKIYSEWFPTSGYELTGGPEILWNESKDTSRPNYKSEIWIPVIKK